MSACIVHMSSWFCMFACLHVCAGASMPTASVAYAWMARAALCTMIGEYWGGWAKSVQQLPYIIGLLLMSKSDAMCYVRPQYWNLGCCGGKWSMKWAAECHQETLWERSERQNAFCCSIAGFIHNIAIIKGLFRCFTTWVLFNSLGHIYLVMIHTNLISEIWECSDFF